MRAHLEENIMFQWQITIEKAAGPSGYKYTLDPAANIQVGDQVFWTNRDDKTHWPGLVSTSDIAGSNPQTYFMAASIPPNRSSTTFIPGVAGTLQYADSLDNNKKKPQGTLVVGSAEDAVESTTANASIA